MLEDMVKNDCAKFGLVTIFFTDAMSKCIIFPYYNDEVEACDRLSAVGTGQCPSIDLRQRQPVE